MSKFPLHLRQGPGMTAELDHGRLLLAFNDDITDDRVRAFISGFEGIAPESEAASGIRLNDGPRHKWISLTGGRTAADDDFVRQLGEAAPVAWVGPVYRHGDRPGLESHFCPPPNALLLRLATDRDEAETLSGLLDRYGLEEDQSRSAGLSAYHFCRPVGTANVYAIADTIRASETDSVAACELDAIPLTSVLNDEPTQLEEQHYASQWSMPRINAPAAWDLGSYPRGHERVYVCIIDNGCQSREPDDLGDPKATTHYHPELYRLGNYGWREGGVPPAGATMGEPEEPATAEGAHGTACAGIVAAEWGAVTGVVGVAPHACIFSLTFPMPASASAVAAAIDAAVGTTLPNEDPGGTPARDAHHRRVILLSVAHDGLSGSGLVTTAIDDAVTANVVVCVPTGNLDSNGLQFPGDHAKVIACGATADTPEVRASGLPKGPGTQDVAPPVWGSNYSDTKPIVCAPGVSIPTTDMRGNVFASYAAGDYEMSFSGTSAAAAHVAGLSVLLLSHNPRLTEEDVRRIISKSCEKIGSGAPYDYGVNPPHAWGTWHDEVGFGRIDAEAACNLALQPRAEVTPTSLDFGAKHHSSTTTLTIDVRHLLTECSPDLDVTIVQAGDSNFTLALQGGGDPLSFSIPAPTSPTLFNARTVEVTYTAPGSGNGSHSATLTIKTDDPLSAEVMVTLDASYADLQAPAGTLSLSYNTPADPITAIPEVGGSFGGNERTGIYICVDSAAPDFNPATSRIYVTEPGQSEVEYTLVIADGHYFCDSGGVPKRFTAEGAYMARFVLRDTSNNTNTNTSSDHDFDVDLSPVGTLALTYNDPANPTSTIPTSGGSFGGAGNSAVYLCVDSATADFDAAASRMYVTEPGQSEVGYPLLADSGHYFCDDGGRPRAFTAQGGYSVRFVLKDAAANETTYGAHTFDVDLALGGSLALAYNNAGATTLPIPVSGGSFGGNDATSLFICVDCSAPDFSLTTSRIFVAEPGQGEVEYNLHSQNGHYFCEETGAARTFTAMGTYTARFELRDTGGILTSSSLHTFDVDLSPDGALSLTYDDPSGATVPIPETGGSFGGSGNTTIHICVDTAAIDFDDTVSQIEVMEPGQSAVLYDLTLVNGHYFCEDGGAPKPFTAEGTYQVRFILQDGAGNTTTSIWHSFDVDLAPTGALSLVYNDANNATVSVPVTGGSFGGDGNTSLYLCVDCAASDFSASASRIYVTEPGGSEDTYTLLAQNGHYFCEDGGAAKAFTAEGIYQVRFALEDNAGNTTSYPIHDFTVDLAPTGSLSLTYNNANASTVAIPELGGNFGGNGNTSLYLCVDCAASDFSMGTSRIYVTEPGSVVEDPYTLRLQNGHYFCDDGAAAKSFTAEGTYTVRFELRDAGSNLMSSNAHTFAVDLAPRGTLSLTYNDTASATFVVPTTGSTFGGSERTVMFLCVDFSSSDFDSTTSLIHVSEPGAGEITYPLVLVDGHHFCDVGGAAKPFTTEGDYTVRIELKDAAGNTTIVSHDFILDLSPTGTLSTSYDVPATTVTPLPASGGKYGDAPHTALYLCADCSAGDFSPTTSRIEVTAPGGSVTQYLLLAQAGHYFAENGGVAQPFTASGMYSVRTLLRDNANDLTSSAPSTFELDLAGPLYTPRIFFDDASGTDFDDLQDGLKYGGPTDTAIYLGFLSGSTDLDAAASRIFVTAPGGSEVEHTLVATNGHLFARLGASPTQSFNDLGDYSVRFRLVDDLTNVTEETITFTFTNGMVLVRDAVTYMVEYHGGAAHKTQVEPVLQVTAAPAAPATSWSWSLEAGSVTTSGMVGTPNLTFTMVAGSSVAAHVGITGIHANDWAAAHGGATPWFTFQVNVGPETMNVTVHLRTLDTAAFLVFERQSEAGAATISAASASGDGYDWSVIATSGIAGFAVEFAAAVQGQLGAIGVRYDPSADGSDLTWLKLGGTTIYDADDIVDGTFDLMITDGNHTPSVFEDCELGLRKLLGDMHLIFEGHVPTEPAPDNYEEWAATHGADESYYVKLINAIGVELSPQPIALNGRAGIAGVPASPPWKTTVAYDLMIWASNGDHRPPSYFNLRDFVFRQLTPADVVIQDEVTPDASAQLSGFTTVAVDSPPATPENWLWANVEHENILNSAFLSTEGSIGDQLTLSWNPGQLKPRETGKLVIDLQRADFANAPLSQTVRVKLDLTIQRDVRIRTLSGSLQLPNARQRTRYQAEVQALLFEFTTGDRLTWEPVSAALGGGILELEALVIPYVSSESAQNTVQTLLGPPLGYIPGTIAAGTYTLLLEVKRERELVLGGGDWRIVDGENQVTMTIEVVETLDDLDVAVLLDRSGSMSGNRWAAACNGAQAFCRLAAEANEFNTRDHRVGVYWFWGNSTIGSVNYPNDPLYAMGQGYHGTFDQNGSTLAINTPQALDHWNEVEATCQAKSPGHYTALGAGLLHCRNELLDNAATDAGGNKLRDRMILALSDGMENRDPKLQQVFQTASPDWNDHSSLATDETPQIRIYSVAMLTNGGWADKLRDVAQETGGIRALDVKHIDHGTTLDKAIIFTQDWFWESFASLFDYHVQLTTEDPWLDAVGNDTGRRTMAVCLGQDTLVFYLLFAHEEPDAWDFRVELPNTSFALTKANANSYDGVTYHEGTLYKMFVVRRPLHVPGHEHRWAGDWTMQTTRTENGNAAYGMGALAHQDLGFTVDIITSPRPRPGDKATLQVTLTDRAGNPIEKADVRSDVHKPAPWIGDALAQRISTDLQLVTKLRRSKSKANLDTYHPADRVLRYIHQQGDIAGGTFRNRRLRETSPGIYETGISLTEPGTWQLNTTVRGIQRFSRRTLAKLLKPQLRKLRSRLGSRPREYERELAYLERRSSTEQSFDVGSWDQLAVLFHPTERHSTMEGFFLDGTTIRLKVTPRDKKRRRLGPGWSDQVVFRGPSGVGGEWPAEDRGDGSYRVNIPFHGKNVRFERHGFVLVADRLTLGLPDGVLRPYGDRLPLEGFSATVLGIRLPIVVQVLVGNRSSKKST